MGESHQWGTVTYLMIAVPAGRYRYRDADGIAIVVPVISRSEVPFHMSVFQYAAAFSDRLDVRRFVLGVHLNKHEFLVGVNHRQMPTARSGWHCCLVHFEGRGAACPQTYGQESDMPFIRMEEEVDCEFRLTRMLLRI